MTFITKTLFFSGRFIRNNNKNFIYLLIFYWLTGNLCSKTYIRLKHTFSVNAYAQITNEENYLVEMKWQFKCSLIKHFLYLKYP